MLVTDAGMLIDSIAQEENAFEAIETTVFGIIVFLQPLINMFELVIINALQLSRESYIAFPSSTTIASILLQFNADEPMAVTDAGIVIDKRLRQS